VAPLNLGKDKNELEKIYTFAKNMMEMDEDKRDGCDLEQFKAHQFLEKNDKALTWVKFGEVVKDYKLPSGTNKTKRVALTEFLLVHYNIKGYKFLVNAVQNVNDEVQKRLDEMKAKMDDLQDKAEAAAAAKKEADEAHSEQKAAHDEVRRILAEIKKHQSGLADAAAKLQAIIDDESMSQVKRMKAKHELMDLKNGSRAKRKGLKDKDPDWLRTAKIKQKAAVRREKAATKVAATAAGIAAETKFAADSALESVQEAFLDLQKNSKGSGEGTVWWMGRQLQDMKKYMSGKAFKALQRKTEKKMAKMKI
jgi:hypothetical protein